VLPYRIVVMLCRLLQHPVKARMQEDGRTRLACWCGHTLFFADRNEPPPDTSNE
jgi:hypothetical protein